MELTVIIPCYRVEEYLPACLDSACGLPAGSVEILCVDDASPDGCGAILADYEARNPHLRVLTHAENRGLSAARNTGLDAAKGEYALFLDGDDLLYADVAMELARQARETRLDILQAAYSFFAHGSGQKLPSSRTATSTGVLSGDACLAQQCARRAFEPMTVIRLYRLAFLRENGLHMDEGLLFEDELFTASAFLCAARAQVSEKMLYRYRQRDGSIMSGFASSSQWCEHYLRVTERLTALCEPPSPGRRAMRRRAASIALSIPKNITAHRLSGEVRRDAQAFARKHAREIARYAMKSGSAALWAQGALMRVSPEAFRRTYALLRRIRCVF